MIPLYDDNPHGGRVYVTYALIGACIVAFLFQLALPLREQEERMYALGLVPAVFFGEARLPPEVALVPASWTLITSMFLHGGLMHLGANMLYLWIFGDNVEVSMGHGRFIAFYLLCGVAAAMIQAMVAPGSRVPMIGASGAISGVLGAYVLLHPRGNVRTLVFLGFFVTMLNIPAIVVLGLWFVGQLLNALAQPADAPGVAFWAHVGGFVAGVVLLPFFKRRDVALFQPAHTDPFRRNWPPRY